MSGEQLPSLSGLTELCRALEQHEGIEFRIVLQSGADLTALGHSGFDPAPAVYVVKAGGLILVPSVDGLKDMQAVRQHQKSGVRCKLLGQCPVRFVMGISSARVHFSPEPHSTPLLSWASQLKAAKEACSRTSANICVYNPVTGELVETHAQVDPTGDGEWSYIYVAVPPQVLAAVGDAWEKAAN